MKKSLAVMLALIMVLCMIPTTAFAEAGDWDPLTDPNTVAGSLVERKTFSASTTMEAGKDGYLRLMPTLDAGNNSYNAMAYCGATATSNNTSIAEVKSIEIGKWVGGVWNNADCLQVTVNPKAAGTTTVVINFYYTFSQSPNPLTNPNAKWFYGTSYYTINVTEPTKPNPPTPENTSKPFIELTGEEAVKVHCTNDNANHDDKSYGLMHDGYTVGDVQGNKENGYTCDITVKPEKYVAQYNLDISGVTHTLVDSNQTGTIKLVWDKDNQKWKLATPSDVPVVFDVKCETQEPPTDTGTIIVTKTVVSNDFADKMEYFKFKVTVQGRPGPAPTEQPPIIKAGAVRAANKTATRDNFNDGVFEFTLKDGETMTISNLPVGYIYRVEELNADGYTVTVNNETTNSKDVELTKENMLGTLEFKNTKGSTPTPTPTPGGGHHHYEPTPVPPIIVNPPKTGDMTIWQSILHFLGIK